MSYPTNLVEWRTWRRVTDLYSVATRRTDSIDGAKLWSVLEIAFFDGVHLNLMFYFLMYRWVRIAFTGEVSLFIHDDWGEILLGIQVSSSSRDVQVNDYGLGARGDLELRHYARDMHHG